MLLKCFGFLTVFLGCGYIGFRAGSNYRKDITVLRQLCGHIEYMICQLRYHQTSLPELFTQMQNDAQQPLRQLFGKICALFSEQAFSGAHECMLAAVEKMPDLPKMTRSCLMELAVTLGRFDLEGQLRGAESVLHRYTQKVAQMERNSHSQIRSYQVFGLCAGAALAILLI